MSDCADLDPSDTDPAQPDPVQLIASIRAQVLQRRPVDARERASLEAFVQQLDTLEQPFAEHADRVHVTGSAIVVGKRGVVLHRHKRLGLWLQPGGHIEPGETPWDAARRETVEETGLAATFPADGPRLVHVDVHPGPRKHVHLDLRYLLEAPDVAPAPPEGESQEVQWFPWHRAIAMAEPGLEGVLRALQPGDAVLRPARNNDAADCSAVYLRSRQFALPDVPVVHDDSDVRRWMADEVIAHADVTVAEVNGMVVGLMVLDADVNRRSGWIEQLYLDPSWIGRGLGERFVQRAKAAHPDGLQLWTFQSNVAAQRFYERLGFEVVERTDGSANEERAPDVRYRWVPPVAGPLPTGLADEAVSMAGRPWWVDATVYQIYVRSFADANGDGRGDLAGIIERLDHLADVGVDALWMTPCYPSPQLDHGYDVADYFDIEPTYGDLATFDRLVAAARERDIRVMMDVVPNHCSDHHVWFQAALRSAPDSHERSRFYFRDGTGEHGQLPPNNWKAIFGGSAWSRTTDSDGTPGQWYLHTFTPWQPDFDWASPDVVEHFDTMLRFWFDRGVDGFRVDAVTVLGKAPGLPDAPEVPPGVPENDIAARNPYTFFWPSAHDVWRHWRSLIDTYQSEHPGRQLVAVGEAYTPRRPDLLLDYVRPDEFHQSFCFDLMLCPWDAGLVRRTIDSVYGPHVAAGAALTWTLNNHDVQRAVTRYGRADATSPDSWTGNNLLYTGTAVDLAVGTRRARAMFAFVAALPGALYLYQGEELGLPEVLDVPLDRRQDPIVVRTEGRQLGRDGCRVPLPWTDDPTTSFGFSSVAPEPEHQAWLPQPDWWGTYALNGQVHDPASMLSMYRDVLGARRRLAAASPLEWVTGPDHPLVAFRRNDHVIVLNLSNDALHLPAALASGMRVVVSSVHGHEDSFTVPGDGCVWLADSSSGT